jgi:hypothetical protein
MRAVIWSCFRNAAAILRREMLRIAQLALLLKGENSRGRKSKSRGEEEEEEEEEDVAR